MWNVCKQRTTVGLYARVYSSKGGLGCFSRATQSTWNNALSTGRIVYLGFCTSPTYSLLLENLGGSTDLTYVGSLWENCIVAVPCEGRARRITSARTDDGSKDEAKWAQQACLGRQLLPLGFATDGPGRGPSPCGTLWSVES